MENSERGVLLSGDLDVFASQYPKTAARIRAELARLRAIEAQANRLLADSEAYAKLRAEIAGLVEKWVRQADGNFNDRANALSRCADELVALLRLPAGDSQDTTTRAQGEW